MLYFGYELFVLEFFREYAKHIGIQHHQFIITDFAREWDRTYLVHFSDMHIGARGEAAVNPETIQYVSQDVVKYLQRVNADPEKTILVDTGDAVSVDDNQDITRLEDVEESLGYLSAIPAHYRFAVEGNHDVVHSRYPEIQELFRSRGYEYGGYSDGSYHDIVNDDQLPFQIITTPDYRTHLETWYASEKTQNLSRALQKDFTNRPRLWLTHDPTAVDFWNSEGITAGLQETLILCGHTHGGQLTPWSPFQQSIMQVGYKVRDYKLHYIRGIHHLGSNILSISPGIGQAKGLRTVPPAVVLYELRA